MVLVSAALCGWINVSSAARVEAVRFWTAPDHTRVVIDLSGPASFHDWVLTGPDRIAIDIRETEFSASVRARAVNDGLLKRIRINRLKNNVSQVVLDLERASRYRTFTLPKMEGKRDRSVIDVFRDAEGGAVERQEDAAGLKGRSTRVIVIDPGHGGEDPGAVGPGRTYEKDICLAVARELANDINRHQGYTAYLTREGDYFVSLEKRVEIARKHQADVFISLHTNASKDKRAVGTEVYFVSLTGATDEAARQVAERENAAHLIGEVSSEVDDNLVSILIDLRKTDTLAKSAVLAERVHEEFSNGKSTSMRGLKQAEFAVLRALDIPSALVELGFITNPREYKKLVSSSFQREAAQAISRGIRKYFENHVALSK